MYVESLKLENIKAFESLELDFKRPDGQPLSGMNVFVGGNASGKSTILKCIAMAVSGPKVADQLLISLEGWVKHEKEKGMIELLGHFDFQNDKILPYDLTRTESNFSEELWFIYNKISKNNIEVR